MTEVKFVKDKRGDFKGDITAVFPYLVNLQIDSVACFDFQCNNGSCTLDWVRTNTVPATKEEYDDLLKELIAWGHEDLKIIKRIQHSKYLKAYYKLLEEMK